MHIVQKPAEKLDRIGLVKKIETFIRLAGDLLEKLVGGDVGFEGARVPYLADKDRKSLDELGSLGQIFEHDEVP